MTTHGHLCIFSEFGHEAREAGRKSHAVCEELLPVLQSFVPVTLFSPSESAKRLAPEGVRCLSPAEYQHSVEGRSIYLLEDGSSNEAIRAAARRHPGVVWFHDINEREPSGTSLLEAASGCGSCLFSSERNLLEYRRLAGWTDECWVLPYPIRERLPVTLSTSSVACCGSPLAEDQMHVVLRAAANAGFPIHLIWMVSPTELESARRLARQFDIDVEIIVGRSLRTWEDILERSALAIHLHVSVYGDPGPSLALSFTKGVPAVVSDFAEAALLPDFAAVKVATGEHARDQLTSAFAELLGAPDSARRRALLAGPARAHALEVYSAEVVAGELFSVIEADRSGLAGGRSGLPHAKSEMKHQGGRS